MLMVRISSFVTKRSSSLCVKPVDSQMMILLLLKTQQYAACILFIWYPVVEKVSSNIMNVL